jgi:Domain of unknown function (DUF4145)
VEPGLRYSERGARDVRLAARSRPNAMRRCSGPLVTFDFAQLFRDCPWCGLRDAHFQLHIAEAGAGRHGGGTRYWSMVSCPRCGGAVTVETAGPHDQSGRVLNVYPEAGADLRVEHLPEDVEGYYRDAIRVLEAGVPDAAAVQLRRTLEAAAAHHGIDSGPLVQRIKKLIDAGHITTDFGTVLDHIRQVGNVGAHATDEHVDERPRGALSGSRPRCCGTFLRSQPS